MTLTKADLIEKISPNGLSGARSTEVLESLLEIMKATLESGEDILVSGFGKFSVKDKRRRKGRNPATGEDLFLDARRIVTFQCSGVLKDKLNPERNR
jgi:integration host factor subunit alpha